MIASKSKRKLKRKVGGSGLIPTSRGRGTRAKLHEYYINTTMTRNSKNIAAGLILFLTAFLLIGCVHIKSLTPYEEYSNIELYGRYILNVYGNMEKDSKFVLYFKLSFVEDKHVPLELDTVPVVVIDSCCFDDDSFMRGACCPVDKLENVYKLMGGENSAYYDAFDIRDDLLAYDTKRVEPKDYAIYEDYNPSRIGCCDEITVLIYSHLLDGGSDEQIDQAVTELVLNYYQFARLSIGS